MALIEARGVSHTYNGATNVLDGVDLTVERGEFVSVLGASGSGKTTLISILGGIERPSSGSVFLDGAEITLVKQRPLPVLPPTNLVFLFHFFTPAPSPTPEQNILLPVYLAGRKKKPVLSRLDSLVDFMGISHRRDALPSQMSGGEQQRTAIARALIYEPEILFLDEPTGNLDSKNAEEVMRLLSTVNSEFGTTIIQVTHSESNALYGGRIIRISDGKIVADEKTEHPAGDPLPADDAAASAAGAVNP